LKHTVLTKHFMQRSSRNILILILRTLVY